MPVKGTVKKCQRRNKTKVIHGSLYSQEVPVSLSYGSISCNCELSNINTEISLLFIYTNREGSSFRKVLL